MLVFAFGLIFLVLTYQNHFSKMKRREAEHLLETSRKSERQERQRIAADLHDGVCGDLSAIRYGLALYEKSDAENAPQLLTEIKHGIENALENTRLVSYKLMPPLLETLGFTAALEDHFERMSAATAIAFKVSGPEIPIPTEDAYELFRVFNEITSNLIKYGEATKCSAEIERGTKHYTILITDDGIPFSFEVATEQSSGSGLRNIVTRLKSINGKIEQLNSSTGNTFLITIQLK